MTKLIKSVLLGACILAFSPSVKAQKNIGIRAGWNSATISGSDFENIKSRDAFYVGIFKEFSLVPKLIYLVPELQYSKQGFESNGTSYTIDYFNVPVMAKVYFLKILSFEAGPQFGFKINDDLETIVSENLETFDMGVAGGIGINLPFGFSINGRYIQGLSELTNNSDAKNRVYQIGAAFKF